MDESDGIGQGAVAMHYKSLYSAAERVAEIEEARKCLKIRSGEHLAAILLTTFLGTVPIGFDSSGEPDLLFEIEVDTPAKKWWPATTAKSAFEIKSLPGPFRKWESQLDPHSSGETFYRTVVSGELVIEDAIDTIRSAADSLAAKCAADCSRNVFLVVHPFDYLAGDIMSSVVASHLLPALPADLAIDTVWVLWVPDNLTMWSRATQSWTEMIFWACNDDEALEEPDQLAVLQTAESRYLEASGNTEGSPYLFGMDFGE